MDKLPARAVGVLSCPHCRCSLRLAEGSVACEQGHRFDVARQGYVSLLGPRARTDTGDSADMVAARAEFLGAGHYAPIAATLARTVAEVLPADPSVLLEIGAGTGYYLDAVLRELTGRTASGEIVGIALDSSRYAARRAAGLPGVASVVADAWSPLPIRDAAVAVALSVFAPRSPEQLRRVLATGGVFVAVTPEPEHLREIRGPLRMLAVDDGKPDRLAASLGGLFSELRRLQVRFEMRLQASDLAALVRMGPTARHRTPDQIAESVTELTTPAVATASVTVSVFATGEPAVPAR